MYLLTLLVGVSFVLSHSARAQQAALTDEHKQRIVANCVSAKASLQRLHRSDAQLRVNRGQLYEFVSAKLMAPLNSRLAMNSLDAADLVSTAAEYETALQQFRATYKTYEESLSAALRIDCTRQPSEFYEAVVVARQNRSLAHEAVIEVGRLAQEFYQSFGQFDSSYRAALRSVQQ